MTKPTEPPEDKTAENFVQRDLAPETHNDEQDDEPEQAQSLADEAIGRATTVFGSDSETERVGDDDDEPGSGTPDIVDHMKQMVTSGRIDMGAFRGERSDDDEEGYYGEGGIDDPTPRGAY
ncbi:MAG: hypothetical protein RIS94_586 [Pseudomonadota bacterium]